MTTTPERATRDSRSVAVVRALVDAGLVEAARRGEAVTVVDGALAEQALPDATTPPRGEHSAAPRGPGRGRLAEIAGYLGGAFVVSAAGVFLATEWGTLSQVERVGILAGAALLLGLAGVAIAALGPGVDEVRSGGEPVRRRLAGVLLVAAAVSAGSAVGVFTEIRMAEPFGPVPYAVGGLTVAVLALAGYVLTPTVVGQAGTAAAAVFALAWFHEWVLAGEDPVVLGLSMVTLGVVWLVVAERGWWRETATGRVVGVGLALLGAQWPAIESSWVAYVALGAVALAGFGLYLVRPAWPYLAAGVAGVTLAVPQALLDLTEGSLGPVGALLATGVTLLAASLAGLRLRREVVDPS